MANDKINDSWSRIGGAYVPHGEIKNQRTETDADGKTRFFIDFKDGTSISYPQQTRNAQVFPHYSGMGRGHMEITAFDGAAISGSDNDDSIMLDNCNNTTVNTRYSDGQDIVYDNGKSNSIFMKKGDCYTRSDKSTVTTYDNMLQDATFLNGQCQNSNVKPTNIEKIQ